MTKDEASTAPQPQERRKRPPLIPLEDPPPDVSNPCLIGRHKRCTGKVAVRRLRNGKRYVKCQCPVCGHPDITRRMPLKG